MANALSEVYFARHTLEKMQLKIISIESETPPAPDVNAILSDNKLLSIEISELYNDDGLKASGSLSLSKELKDEKSNPSKPRMTWFDTTALYEPIEKRIKLKCSKKYSLKPNQELWLILVSNVPELVAIAPTMFPPVLISPSQLNEKTHNILCESTFDKVIINFMLSEDENIYEWTKIKGWIEFTKR